MSQNQFFDTESPLFYSQIITTSFVFECELKLNKTFFFH